MAKESKEGKIQLIFVNLEGDQETLQEALRQFGGVVNRNMYQPPEQRTLIAVPVPKGLGGGGQNENDTQQVYEVKSNDNQDASVHNGKSSASSAENKPKRERKAPPIPALLKDFDPNDAEVSFEEFVKQKDTSTQTNKYLVIGAWFKKYKESDEINPSHIYTCFQLMKWSAPDDMGQPFRDLKKRNSYFDNGTKRNSWKITIVGLNEVDKMKPTNSTGE